MRRLCTILLIAVPLFSFNIAGRTGGSPSQGNLGTIEGVVERMSTKEPISEVEITLAGETFEPKALAAFLQVLARNGVTIASPANGPADEGFLQTVIDAAALKGVSLGRPELTIALNDLRKSNELKFTALTDRAGRFRLSGISPGRYTVQARKEGFFAFVSSGSNPVTATVDAAVNVGETTSVTLSMFPGGTISGQVTEETGAPQVNLNVDVYSVVYQNGFPVLQSAMSKTTDDRGEYRLFYLPPGDYYVAANPKPPSVNAPSQQQLVRTFFPGTTDPSTAIPITIKPGERVERIDIRLRRVTTLKLSGRINSTIPRPATTAVNSNTSAREPLIEATMMLLQRDTNAPDSTGFVLGSGLKPVGNASIPPSGGPFEVTGILPGSYDLYARVTDPSPEGGSGYSFGKVAVDVRDTDIGNLVIDVHHTVSVTGKVSLDGGPPVQSGIRIALQVEGSAAKIPIYQGITQRPATPSPQDGSFNIPAVTSGHFRIMAPSLPAGIFVSDVMQGSSVYDAGFDIMAEPPNPLQIILRSGAATVEGTAKNAGGRGMARAVVVLIPPEGRRQNRMLYHTATTDASGHFTIRSVAPGTYKVFAWENAPESAYYNPAFISKYEDRGQPITVAQNSSVRVDLTAIENSGR